MADEDEDLVRPLMVGESPLWSIARNLDQIQSRILNGSIDMSYFDVIFDESKPRALTRSELGLGDGVSASRVSEATLPVFLVHAVAVHGMVLPPWNPAWGVADEEAVAWLTEFWTQRNARLHLAGVERE